MLLYIEFYFIANSSDNCIILLLLALARKVMRLKLPKSHQLQNNYTTVLQYLLVYRTTLSSTLKTSTKQPRYIQMTNCYRARRTYRIISICIKKKKNANRKRKKNVEVASHVYRRERSAIRQPKDPYFHAPLTRIVAGVN